MDKNQTAKELEKIGDAALRLLQRLERANKGCRTPYEGPAEIREIDVAPVDEGERGAANDTRASLQLPRRLGVGIARGFSPANDNGRADLMLADYPLRGMLTVTARPELGRQRENRPCAILTRRTPRDWDY